MANKRFSDILRADELKAAKDEYEKWMKLSRAEKKAAYNAVITASGNQRTARQTTPCFVRIYGDTDAIKVYTVSQKITGSTAGEGTESSSALASSLVTLLKDYTHETAAAEKSITIKLKRGDLALCKLSKEKTGAIHNGTSRFTKIPYRTRLRDTISQRFGQKAANSSYFSDKTNITKAVNKLDGYSVSFEAQGNIDLLAA